MDRFSSSLSVDWSWSIHWSAFRPGILTLFIALWILRPRLRYDDDELVHSVLAVCARARFGRWAWLWPTFRTRNFCASDVLFQQEGPGAGNRCQWK